MSRELTGEGGGFYADEKCHRCGVCCGATDGHPCEHLKYDSEKYFCEKHLHYTETDDDDWIFYCSECVKEMRKLKS